MTFNRKLNPIKERRPWSLLKNPANAELMHIYVNTFPWRTTLCFYGYQNVTRSKVTGNFLVNALYAFHRFNRRYHVKNPSISGGFERSIYNSVRNSTVLNRAFQSTASLRSTCPQTKSELSFSQFRG